MNSASAVRAQLHGGRGRNLLQIHLPAEGDWLSVAHLLPPGAGIGVADGRRAKPDSRVVRHPLRRIVPGKSLMLVPITEPSADRGSPAGQPRWGGGMRRILQ